MMCPNCKPHEHTFACWEGREMRSDLKCPGGVELCNKHGMRYEWMEADQKRLLGIVKSLELELHHRFCDAFAEEPLPCDCGAEERLANVVAVLGGR